MLGRQPQKDGQRLLVHGAPLVQEFTSGKVTLDSARAHDLSLESDSRRERPKKKRRFKIQTTTRTGAEGPSVLLSDPTEKPCLL